MTLVRFRPAPRAIPRALLATVEIMLGVTVAHTWAGGTLPPVFGLVLLTGIVLAASLLVVRGRIGLRTAVPLVLAAQVGLHTVFALTAPAHHAAPAVAAPLHLTWQMVLAHAIGTVVTVLVWTLRQRAAEAILNLVVLRPVPARVRAARRTTSVVPGCRGIDLLCVSPLRGPPVPA